MSFLLPMTSWEWWKYHLYWLVVWNVNFIFHFIYGIINPSHWLIFFQMVKTTNQYKNGDDWGMVYHCFSHIDVFFCGPHSSISWKPIFVQAQKFVRNRGVQILGLFLLPATLSSLFLLLAFFQHFFHLVFLQIVQVFFYGTNGDGNNTCVALVVASCLNPHVLLVHLPCLVLECPAALLYARMCLERSLFRWVNKGGMNYLEW